jgi:hypothetical protein
VKFTVRTALFAALSILFWLSAGMAEVGGKITGVVKDQTGGIIPGATVVVLNTATGVKQTTVTNAEGTYSFPVLAVGQYDIDVTADGFKPK